MFDKNFFPIRRQKLKIGCLKFSIYEGFNCYRGVLRHSTLYTIKIFCAKLTKKSTKLTDFFVQNSQKLTFSECQKQLCYFS